MVTRQMVHFGNSTGIAPLLLGSRVNSAESFVPARRASEVPRALRSFHDESVHLGESGERYWPRLELGAAPGAKSSAGCAAGEEGRVLRPGHRDRASPSHLHAL